MNTTRALTLFLGLALAGFVLLALPISTARAAEPVIIRVTTTGKTSDPCGDTWANACGLQYALTSTIEGSELWVAAGTYTPTTATERTATFQLRDDIALYGGFAGSEAQRTQRNFTTNVTILSGDIGVPGDNSDNAYHVVTGSGVTNTAVLDGFTVTGGNGVGYADPHSYGGGMSNDGGSPTVTNVTFSSNFALYGGGMSNRNNSNPTLKNVTFSGNSSLIGGGMSNYQSGPTLTNVAFSGNSAVGVEGNGGGMYNDSSSPTLTNVTFSSNSAIGPDGRGGGMYNQYSSPTLTNATLTGNTTDYAGGGMYNFDSSPTLTNVTFSANSAVGSDGHCGGMYNYRYSNPTLTNTTLMSNTARTNGGGICNVYNSNPTIRNTIFWANNAPSSPQIYIDSGTPIVSDCVVQGGYAGGTHIITSDPLLGLLGNYGGSTQTIPLLRGSSAIDAGDDAHCSATDQRGFPRPYGPHCDIGAYESQGFTLIDLPLLSK